MTATLMTDLTVEDICKGFVYNELEGKGLFGWGGRLVIQPEYQRNYIYNDHVAAWSKGGATDAANCQMLCKTHNRAKGNR